ncbi:MAG TPA: Crp/Fnr family transcriptional regulator [Clostridiales bacterium]|nr:Crp/Fnr family transcriptional regulator [Clostridiales bacterium]
MTKDQFLSDTLRFWEDLDNNQKIHLNNSIEKHYFEKGESMKGSSDHCSGIFLIESGQVRAYIISENGKEITLFRMFERDVCIFTASCIMKNITFEVYVEVEKPTEAYLIPTQVYKNLASESLPVQAFMNDLMASNFSDVMWIMEQALFTSFDKRLAMFLLEQINIEGSTDISITHEKIANNMGTAREVVSRMLKYFQNEGLVALARGGIQILDEKRLQNITF